MYFKNYKGELWSVYFKGQQLLVATSSMSRAFNLDEQVRVPHARPFSSFPSRMNCSHYFNYIYYVIKKVTVSILASLRLRVESSTHFRKKCTECLIEFPIKHPLHAFPDRGLERLAPLELGKMN